MEAKNIDDVLVAEMNNTPLPSTKEKEVVEPVNDPVQPDEIQPEAAKDASPPIEATKTEEKPDSPIDEYGNPIEKQKVYTEEEVNKLIRERVARIKKSEQPLQPSQPQQQTAEQEENWQQELEKLVDQTIDKRQSKITEQQWQQAELARQVEFESKFNEGMGRYNDFREVVAGKPITDSMMLATRNLENPAAFIYGAAKFHGQELERIAKIPDTYAQVAEIGRLHERMIKTKNMVSNAPKPIEAVTSDIPAKNVAQFPSIEERIAQYAKQKRK